MKGPFCAAVGLAMLLFVGLVAWSLHETSSITKWNQWVNKVCVAGETGSTEQTARQMLGEPDKVMGVSSVGVGFSPSPVIPGGTRKTLVYRRVFPLAGGLWEAYVFVDANGQVLRSHIAGS